MRKAGTGAVLPTADFPDVCRLEVLQAEGQQVCADSRQLCCWEVLGCSSCFVCALCLAVLEYWLVGMMSISGLCKPFSLFSGLLWGCSLVVVEITLSPLPGHKHLLCVYLWGEGMLDNSALINWLLCGVRM